MFVVPQTLASVMENLPQTNMAELLISLVCLAILVPVKEVNMRCRKRLRTPIPVEILTVRHNVVYTLGVGISGYLLHILILLYYHTQYSGSATIYILLTIL